jgi:asparagine synthase (glutamine-hydrolysing)
LSEEFIRKQNIFNSAVITQIRTKLHSQNPGDSAAHIWALLVFQTWWKKHIAHD